MPPQSNAARRAASLARDTVDLRARLHPEVRRQFERPTCLPFAISLAHEGVRAAVGDGQPEVLAVESLWRHCVEAGAADEDGTTLHAAFAAVEQSGQPLDALWPYNPILAEGTESPPSGAEPGTATYFTTYMFRVPLLNDGIEEEVEATLAEGLPVVVVLELTDEFDEAGPDGEIAVPPLTAEAGDYHAVTAVGAETSPDGTSRRLLVQNSWGSGWGADGFGWLPLDYLVAFGAQAGAVDPNTLGTR